MKVTVFPCGPGGERKRAARPFEHLKSRLQTDSVATTHGSY